MNTQHLSKKKIMQMVVDQKISPKHAWALYKRHKNENNGEAANPKSLKGPARPIQILRHRGERDETRAENTAGDRQIRTGSPAENALAMPSDSEIAVIGISCRYPCSKNKNAFWQNLADGRNCTINGVPKHWELSANNPNTINTEKQKADVYGGFLDDIDQFDHRFFNISPREAEMMDPQQRVFLQEAWHAVEDAGYSDQSLSNLKCGVFVGTVSGDYGNECLTADLIHNPHTFTGISASILAARISYFMNLKGPCIAVDTACSSSLVAICKACESIVNGESELALAGGISITFSSKLHILAGTNKMSSATGKCRSFDKDADGIVISEGAGIVVLKPLKKALSDSDHIYGVIKGWGLNNDGKTNGITAPNATAQTELELSVYRKANVNPETINYIETHGTGTKLGDPVEIKALRNAFDVYTRKKQFCPIGSVKSNIGHTTLAAGVAGVIKVLLSLENEKIPPTIHYREANENINFRDSQFFVNTDMLEWKKGIKLPRRAAVSSFGYSGTNAHIIIDEAPDHSLETVSRSTPYHLICLSAKTKKALDQKIKDLTRWLGENDHERIDDIAYTLLARRAHFIHRAAIIAKDLKALRQTLRDIADGKTPDNFLIYYKRFDTKKKEENDTGRIENVMSKLGGKSTLPPSAYKEAIRELAAFYIRGYDPDWKRISAYGQCTTLSMPVYPFAPYRHWLPTGDEPRAAEVAKKKDESFGSMSLHPLLDRNISDFEAQQFVKRLTGDEFYLRDHVVAGRKVLPGVAYIEMARAAGEISGKAAVRKIRSIVWATPVSPGDQALDIMIRLHPGEKWVDYQVTSAKSGARGGLHAQGKLILSSSLPSDTNNRDRLDLEAIIQRCPAVLSRKDCYARFQLYGLAYGPSFQVIEKLFYNETEALSRLVLPKAEAEGEFSLHPSLMDGALQSVLGMAENPEGGAGAPYLPFSLQEVEILAPLVETCYAHVTLSPSHPASSDRIKKFNVRIVDAEGLDLVRVKDFTLRALQSTHEKSGRRAKEEVQKKETVEMSASKIADEPEEKADRKSLLKKIQRDLVKIVSAVLKVDSSDIDANEDMQSYGFESITMTEFSTEVNAKYNIELTPATFFELPTPTIASLSAYLLAEQEAGIIGFYQGKSGDSGNSHVAGQAAIFAEGSHREDHVQAVDNAPLLQKIQRDLVKIVSRVLKVDPSDIDANEDMQSYGFESITMTEFGNAVNAKFSTGMTPATFFELPSLTIASLSRHLLSENEAGMMQAYREDAETTGPASAQPVDAPGKSPLRSRVARQTSEPTMNDDYHEPAGDGNKAQRPQNSETFCCRMVWEEEKGAVGPRTYPAVSGNILIFDDTPDLAEALKAQLPDGPMNPPEITLVRPGPSYRRVEDGSYEIHPKESSDYGKLLDALGRESCYPENIIYHWSESVSGESGEALTARLARGLYSLFHLTRALMDRSPMARIGLIYLHSGDNGTVVPENAALGGFVRTIRQENPKFVYKTVGLAGEEHGKADAAAEAVLRELSGESGIEIRYMDGLRYEKHLREFDALNVIAHNSGPEKLRERGVYLITGGMGGLGYIFAEHLSRCFNARLVLTGRREADSDIDSRMRKLRDLGAEAVYIQADISQHQDVARLIAAAKAEFGQINGIIHSAGIVRDALIQNKPFEDLQDVLAPKVFGGFHLDRATKDEPLDFFILFSSIAGALGNAGQCDYAYANSFMDHFSMVRERMRRRKARTGKTLSINWPLWAAGGMTVHPQIEKTMIAMGMNALSTETGLAAFSTGLSAIDSPFLLFEGDGPKIRRTLGLAGAPVKDELSKHQPAVSGKPSLLEKIQRDLAIMVSRVLKVDPSDIDVDEDMQSYGFESITMTEFCNEVNTKYTIGLTPATFFELPAPTIASLSRHLLAEHEAGMMRVYRDDAKTVAGVSPQPLDTPGASPDRPRYVKPTVKEVTIDGDRDPQTPESIAVIGMSGVMPQSPDLASFWAHLTRSADLITETPPERWDWRGENKMSRDARWGGFVTDVDKFDPLFFGISPNEAKMMDPQQRIFIETVWKTIENAGYKMSELSGTRTGLFVGVSSSDYVEVVRAAGTEMESHLSTGMAHSIVANRISYLFDLRGPSEPVDTACSSSLVAIHRGIEAIRSGSCDLAIAGGVNVILNPAVTFMFNMAGMLSKDGRCKTFDQGADGYVRGEGAGAVLLKPLPRAEADGDHIYGLVRGTAVNHGGRANSLTAPNTNAQAALLVDAYERAQVDPATVTYIEAHGTGTKIGDPVEVNALKMAFEEMYRKKGNSMTREAYCGIGSVKTNIGHLEAASGIAGFFKVLLSFQHGTLPASINFETLNPYIHLQKSPFYILTKTRPWLPLEDAAGNEIPRRAGVSSFGFGGANAHVILEEYRKPSETPESKDSDSPLVFVLSAKNTETLKSYAEKWVSFIKSDGALGKKEKTQRLIEMAYTAQVGRESMDARMAVIAGNGEALRDKLAAYIGGEKNIDDVYVGKSKRAHRRNSVLNVDEDARAMIEQWVMKGKYHRIAALWVEGLDLDWKLLYPGKQPNRMPIPTYPFERTRCWIKEKTIEPVAKARVADAKRQNDREDPVGRLSGEQATHTPRISEYDREVATPNIENHTTAPATKNNDHAMIPLSPRKASQTAPEAENPKHLASHADVVPFDIGMLPSIISDITGIAIGALDMELSFDEFGVDSILSMKIVKAIESRFGLAVYANELNKHNTISKLKDHIKTELQHGSDVTASAPVTPDIQSDIKPVVYILSAPRSGSTLLRVMLGGHAEIFSPPELHLLPFKTMKSRSTLLKQRNADFLTQGLIRAVSSLEKISTEDAIEEVRRMEARELETERVYSLLQEKAKGRYVVDKSPTYAMSLETLERAEAVTPDPIYIFLVRHPLSVMASFVQNRFDKLFDLRKAPWQAAETIWRTMNDNIKSAVSNIPPHRKLVVQYEDLVKSPHTVMQQVCRLLKIKFSEAMLEPYAGERITGGIYDESMSIGDPNFLKHSHIKPELAEAWKNHLEKAASLDEKTVRLAHEFGYALEIEENRLAPVQATFLKKFPQNPVFHIVQHVKMRLKDGFDVSRFRKALDILSKKHHVFGHYFIEEKNGWVRHVQDDVVLPFAYEDLGTLDASSREQKIKEAVSQANQELSIKKAPLLHFAVFRIEGEQYHFALIVHHLIADGLSLPIVIKDTFALYKNPDSGTTMGNAQYIDYIRCLARFPQDLLVDSHAAYWKAHTDGEKTELPLDKKKGANTVASEKEYRTRIPYEDLNNRNSTSPGPPPNLFYFLSNGLYEQVSKWTGGDAPVVAHRLHGRNLHKENFSDAVGWFASDIPIRFHAKMGETEPVPAFKTLFKSLPMGGATYELLAAKGDVPHAEDVSQIRFNFQPYRLRADGDDMETETELIEYFANRRLYLLDCIIRSGNGHFDVIVRYSENFHLEKTVEDFIHGWISGTKDIIHNGASTNPKSNA